MTLSKTTAFRLVRRLLLGRETASMYLLICGEATQADVEADLGAEVEVQMATSLQIHRVSNTQSMEEALLSSALQDPIRLLNIDRWSVSLVSLFDTHVIRLEQAHAQFLFLTTRTIAERLLKRAPNFRNRLTEILEIVPERLGGGGTLAP